MFQRIYLSTLLSYISLTRRRNVTEIRECWTL